MSKYIRIFCLTVFLSGFLFFIFGSIFISGGDPAEEAVYIIGMIIIMLLSFLITQIFYLINLVNKRL
ncbi:hypothetical protein CHH83_25160 [Bacillus sp. 7586-K]|nr:hypothetical protein CHH83_25160 [Bacillus sp. 7586-K]